MPRNSNIQFECSLDGEFEAGVLDFDPVGGEASRAATDNREQGTEGRHDPISCEGGDVGDVVATWWRRRIRRVERTERGRWGWRLEAGGWRLA